MSNKIITFIKNKGQALLNYLDRHLSPLAWFLLLWCVGLIAVLLLAYPFKFMIYLIAKK